MLRRRTMRGPSTGVFHMPVWTVLSCQVTSRGSPTLTESKRPITCLSVLAEFPSTISSAGEVIRILFLPEETTRQLDEILHHHRRFVLAEDEKHVGRRRR